MWRLKVFESGGADRQEFDVENALTFGRKSGNDIVVADQYVSRNHAKFSLLNEELSVEDNASQAGIYLNGDKIYEKSRLNPGDEMLIGLTKIVVEEVSHESCAGGEDEKTRILALDFFNRNGESDTLANGNGENTLTGNNDKKYEDGCESSGEDTKNRDAVENPKLIEFSHGNLGGEIVLDRTENIIGRSDSSAVVLKDRLVSGIHAQVSLKNGKHFIKDLNSKNGTFLNGKALSKEKRIKTADELKIGGSSFIFVDKEEKLSARELNMRLKRKMIFTIVKKICFAAVFLLAISLAFWSKNNASFFTATKEPDILSSQHEPESQSIFVGNPPEVVSLAANRSVEFLFVSANQLLEKRLWEASIAKFGNLLEIEPNHPTANDGILRAQCESANRDMLEKGFSMIENDQYEKGIELISNIPADSVYYQEALDGIELAKGRLESHESKEVASNKDAAPRSDSDADIGINDALNYYAQGFLKLAVNKIDELLKNKYESDASVKENLAKFKTKIESIRDFYASGLKEYENSQYNKAFEIWEQALILDKEILGSSKSHYADNIASYITDVYFASAREKYDKGKYDEALDFCKVIERVTPGYAGIKKIKKLISKKQNELRAKKLLEEGYLIKDIDSKKAIEKWKKLIALYPEESEYTDKASALIAKYSK